MKEVINLDSYLPDFEKVLERLKRELAGLRTGRANAAILDAVMIEAYGTKMALKSVASIAVPDARNIVVEPWDKNLLKEVEKGIIEARLGINPVNDGKSLRLPMPPLTEENRKGLIKILSGKLEEGRVEARRRRDEIREKIFVAAKDKLMGEDQRYSLLERLDELARQYNEKIKKIGEEKEKEIMTI